MRTLTKTLLGTAAAGALVACFTGGAIALPADTVILNPSAHNGGAGTIDPSQGAFATTGATTSWDGLMSIDGKPTAPGTQNFQEAGVFWVTQFQNGAANVGNVGSPTANVNGTCVTYCILGTASLSGTGSWAPVVNTHSVTVGYQYNITSAVTLNVALWGASAPVSFSLAPPTKSDPANVIPNNSAGQLAEFGINSAQTNGGVLLDLAQVTSNVSLVSGGNFVTTDKIVSGQVQPCLLSPTTACKGTESLNIAGTLTPQPGTTGGGGFFQQPIPFDVTFELAPNTTVSETTVTDPSSCASSRVTFTGPCTTVKVSNGGGSISFLSAAVPEPGSLTLLGSGLLGLGMAIRRRRRKAS